MAVEQITGAEKDAILKRYGRQPAKKKARRRKPRVKSGLRREPIPKKAPKTAAQNRQFQKKKAAIEKASIAESVRVRDERIVINERRVAAGRKPRDVPPIFTPGTFVQPNKDVVGIPLRKPPTIFKQEYTGPSSPPAQERPLPPFVSARQVPGIKGSIEAITGQQMEDILAAAGIPRRGKVASRSVSSRSATDPYSVFFS